MESKAKPKVNESTTNSNSQMAVVAYITIIGLIIAIVDNQNKKDEMVAYHIRQSAGIAGCAIALFVISFIPILGWIIWLVGIFALLFMWIMGLVNAAKPIKKPVPILGDKFEVWLKETF